MEVEWKLSFYFLPWWR